MFDRSLLLVCAIGVVGVSAAAQSAPKLDVRSSQPPPPLAAPIEEPIRDKHGRQIATLVYRLNDDQPPARRFTIAQRRWIGSHIALLPAGRRSVTMRCPILPDGTIADAAACVAEEVADDYALEATERLGTLLRPAVPPIPVAESAAPARALRYRISLDTADWPGPTPLGDRRVFDRAAAQPIVALLHRQMRNDFPEFALTLRLEARVTLQCFLEEDRSVSCRTQSVDPVVAQPYYRSAIDAIFPRGRLPERLSDGTPTPGLVFRVPFQFLIED